MVAIFKTDIRIPELADYLAALLRTRFPGCRIHFDLHDPECILRVEGAGFEAESVCALLAEQGWSCEELS